MSLGWRRHIERDQPVESLIRRGCHACDKTRLVSRTRLAGAAVRAGDAGATRESAGGHGVVAVLVLTLALSSRACWGVLCPLNRAQRPALSGYGRSTRRTVQYDSGACRHCNYSIHQNKAHVLGDTWQCTGWSAFWAHRPHPSHYCLALD